MLCNFAVLLNVFEFKKMKLTVKSIPNKEQRW